MTMMNKEYVCPVCKKDNLGDMLLHIALNADEEHLALVDPIINYTNSVAKDKYAFEIADDIVHGGSMLGIGVEAISKDINSLTSFISRVIVALGYNRRKCLGKSRKTVALENYIGLSSKTKLEMVIASIPRKIKNLSNNSFVPDIKNKVDVNEHYVEITKMFSFGAGHHLPGHPRLCQYSHGHEWVLEVSVYDKADPVTNMVLDFSDLKRIVNFNVIEVLDHNYINDIVYNPTAENLCAWIFEELYSSGLYSISKIKLWEAKDSFAVLKRKDFFLTTNFVLG